MGEPITSAQLKNRLGSMPPVERVTETADTWYLGDLGVHRHQPLFRCGYYVELSPDSHFRLHPFTTDEVGFDGVAIVFHQFTSSRFSNTPSEELAGWVPPVMAEHAMAWVEEGNERIRARLAAKASGSNA